MSTIIKILIVLVVVAVGAMVLNVVAPYLPASLSIQKNSSIEKSVVENVKKSIVAMQTSFGIRSGLVLTGDGLVVALQSVLNQKNVIPGFIAGYRVSLKNLHMASENLALLRIVKDGLSNFPFADESKIQVDQKVFLVAATSFDQNNWVVREGAIRHVNEGMMVTDIAGSPEIVSSPLFTLSGELIGVVYLDDSNRIVALSLSQIRKLFGL